MLCPKCGSDQVYTRETRQRDTFVTRRRICYTCLHLFTTHELIEGDRRIVPGSFRSRRKSGEEEIPAGMDSE